MAKRPRQLPPRPPLSEEQIENARYVGSPEHKEFRWWGGLPEAWVDEDGNASRPGKQQTTICPLVTKAERKTATEWVRAALRAGQMLYRDGDKDFPTHIWHRDTETGKIWRGFCVNTVSGEYKGWPIEEDERVEVFG